MKHLKTAFQITILSLASIFLFAAFGVYTFAQQDEARKADAAIVLGAAAFGDQPSPVLRERINHAILLYEESYVEKIIFTGGKGSTDSASEAEISARYAIANGIPENAILTEKTSKSSTQNLINAQEIAKNNDLEQFLIVSTPSHMKRVIAIANELGMEAYSSPTRTIEWINWFTKTRAYLREVFGYVNYLFGDIYQPPMLKEKAMPQTSLKILEILRDGSNFQWYVIPLLSFVFYVYTVEVEKKNWNLVLAGLAFWGADWINEIINSLVFHFSGYAPIWGTPGDSAFVILAGLNIEIMFMFAVAGIVWTKMLLPDKNAKILGINNRWFIAIAGSAFSVFVEILLNQVNALTWEYAWWNTSAPWLIFIFGYLTFFIVAFWVYDMEDFKKKVITVGSIWGVAIISLILFISIGWI